MYTYILDSSIQLLICMYIYIYVFVVDARRHTPRCRGSYISVYIYIYIYTYTYIHTYQQLCISICIQLSRHRISSGASENIYTHTSQERRS